MVKRSNSLSNLNQLLTVSVRVVHYVELHTKDQFTAPIFQYRLEQHLLSPWREPKKPVKGKLVITYTSLILYQASWWPFRLVERLPFDAVERCMSFPQVGPFFAIGIQDNDFAEKQFIVMTTKTLHDMQRVMQVMEAQLGVWKNPDGPYTREFPPPSIIRRRSSSQQNSVEPATSNQKDTSAPKPNPMSDTFQQTDTPRLEQKHVINGNNSFEMKRCECPPKQFSRIYLKDREQPKHSVHILSEPEEISEPKPTKSLTKVEGPRVKADRDGGPGRSKHNPTTGQRNSTDKEWEVDVKYIRYDPVLGNVLDADGSVYLYTAHQIRK